MKTGVLLLIVGLLVGAGIGVLMRPSIPMLGQPPIDLAFNALSNPTDAMDRSYASAFGQMLMLCSLIGAVAGGAVGFIVSKLGR